MSDSSTFGRYVVRRRLASGGMGEVFVAEQTGVGGFKKPLALKLMLQTMADDPRLVRLFLAEVRLATRLQHPNIVQVFDAGVIDGRYFLSMELVDGATLGTLISKARAASEQVGAEVICHVARQTLDGLRYAQELRDDTGQSLDVVHRDISPSNILVSRRGEVKLTDFGIAKVRGDESNTAPGEVRGKLAYLAPELLRGASATARSDVFALGVTLYRLASLASPYSSSGDSDPTADVLRGEVMPLAQRRPDLPAAITSAIDRAIARDPKGRFPTAAAMLEAFPKGDFEARQQALQALVSRLLGDPEPAAAPVGTAPLEVLTARSLLAEPAPKKSRKLATAVASVLMGVLALSGALVWKQMGQQKAPSPLVGERDGVRGPSSDAQELPLTPTLSPTRKEGDVAEPPPPVPEPEPTAPAQRRTSRKPPKQPLLSSPAYLSVQAQPWADVELNGKPIGQTPLGRVPVDTPVAVLRLTNPGFRPIERRFKLAAGEEQKVNVRLEPKGTK